MKYTKERIAELRKSWRPNKGYPVRGETLIDMLDEIERLQSENRWIPVSERLPEDNTLVIAVHKFGDSQNVFPSWFRNSKFHYQAEMIYECEDPVTHWRPLPQPPEKI